MAKIQKFLIAPFTDGLDSSLEPWLLPNDAFVKMQDAFVYRGVLKKRDGFQQLAVGNQGSSLSVESRIISRSSLIVSESIGTTDGSGDDTDTVASPAVHVGTFSVTVAGGTPETFTDNGDGTLTGSVTGTGTIVYSTGVWSITGSNATQAITASYTSSEGFVTDVSGELTDILASTPIRHGIVIKVAGATVETFSDDGAGILTGDQAGTGTIDYSTGAITLTGTNASEQVTVLYDEFTELPVMGIFNYINSSGTRVFCALDTRNFNKLNSTINQLDYVTHLSATTYTGTDSDFWSATNLDVLDSATPALTKILVFTNNIDKIQYFDGTYVDDLDQHAEFDDPTDPELGGVLQTCKLVFFYGNRLVCLNTKQKGYRYPTRALYSGTLSLGASLDFAAATSGFLDADTEDEIMGAQLFGNDLIVFFRNSLWSLKRQNDEFYPFRWERLDAQGIFNCDAPFSVSSYFGEVTGLGKLGWIGTDGNSVGRIDNKNPFFFKNKIDQKNIDYSYAGISTENQQRWISYSKAEDDIDYPQEILINNLEENNFSIYTIPMHCFGSHQYGFDSVWDDFTDPWDTYDLLWDDYSTQETSINLVGGNHSGYLFLLEQGAHDDQISITNITQADPGVVTVQGHSWKTGDKVYFFNVGGMEELEGSYYTITVANSTSFSLDVDTTNFTAYTSGGHIQKAIPFDVKTKPLNPWIDQDMRAHLHWVDFRLSVSDIDTMNVQFFTEERDSPYIVQDQNSDTIELSFADESEDSSAIRAVRWYRIYVGNTAYNHQIRLFHEKVGQSPKIHAIRLAMSPSGTLESI